MGVRDAVRDAQSILNRENVLKVDGWWGLTTEKAYGTSSDPLRKVVDKSIAQAGYDVNDLRMPKIRNMMNPASNEDWLSESQLARITADASALSGISRDYLVKFARLESDQLVVGGMRFYNAKSISPNGLYRGLFQMGKPAWSDVRDKVKHGYDKVFDPSVNAIAAAYYMLQNMSFARDKGYTGKFSVEVLYAMHNQGAGGFMSLLKSGQMSRNLSVQSGEAIRIVKLALAQNDVTVA